MSFSSDIKKELCDVRELSPQQAEAMLYGIMYASRMDEGRPLIQTENIDLMNAAAELIRAVFPNVRTGIVRLVKNSGSLYTLKIRSGWEDIAERFGDFSSISREAVSGGDEDYDIAVIKVEGTNFQPVVIGKSGSVQIGETVAAVGNPLGELTFSMSQGIVSCVNRAINVDGKPFNMIQVDCSINPGNSGGPLFNSYGEVIGIVSAKYSSYSNTTVEGIGFAIPIDDVLAMVKDIMTDGYVTNKPYIGITPQNMTAQMAQQYRYDVTQGVFVCSVEPGSAAEKAGLQMGDVITKIGDTAISDMNDLNAAKKSYRAGDTVTLTIYRAGGTKEVELTFDAVPQTQETAQDNSQQQQGGNNGGNGGYYYNPWDFFNSFFGNGYYGSSYSGESRDAA